MFAQHFEYYANILGGVFVDTL